MAETWKTHKGGCHCGKVRFEFDAPEDVIVWRCNCSLCKMKRNDHIIIPKSRFRLLQGEDCLTLYTFNTHKAQHLFCQYCGVQAFYVPRSNPDGYGVTYYCVDEGTIKKVEFKDFDGQNWEACYTASSIKTLSQE